MLLIALLLLWSGLGLAADFVTSKEHISAAKLYPHGLSYQKSIEVIALNEVIRLDGSSGVVWFNTTDYCIKNFQFREIGYNALVTHEAYNYLTVLTNLATVAKKKGRDGDFVFLLFKFLHEGKELPTTIRRFSPMVYDMAKSLDPGTPFWTKNHHLLEYLKQSTDIPIIKKLYAIVLKERRSYAMKLYRSVAKKLVTSAMSYTDDSMYFLFVRLLGVPIRSSCQVKSVDDSTFLGFDTVLSLEIDRCRESTELDFYGQACSIRLVLPRSSVLRTGKCN